VRRRGCRHRWRGDPSGAALDRVLCREVGGPWQVDEPMSRSHTWRRQGRAGAPGRELDVAATGAGRQSSASDTTAPPFAVHRAMATGVGLAHGPPRLARARRARRLAVAVRQVAAAAVDLGSTRGLGWRWPGGAAPRGPGNSASSSRAPSARQPPLVASRSSTDRSSSPCSRTDLRGTRDRP
jgi:hypothetical protein